MNITAAHQQTVTGLLDAADLAGLSKGTELRANFRWAVPRFSP